MTCLALDCACTFTISLNLSSESHIRLCRNSSSLQKNRDKSENDCVFVMVRRYFLHFLSCALRIGNSLCSLCSLPGIILYLIAWGNVTVAWSKIFRFPQWPAHYTETSSLWIDKSTLYPVQSLHSRGPKGKMKVVQHVKPLWHSIIWWHSHSLILYSSRSCHVGYLWENVQNKNHVHFVRVSMRNVHWVALKACSVFSETDERKYGKFFIRPTLVLYVSL